MSTEKRTDSKLKEWLDKMETESWQLELILSGFVVFLLLLGLEPYHDLGARVDNLDDENNFFAILELPYHVFRIAYYVLTVAIIFHVFLRGLWISTIGLRSVSGDIEWDQFNLAPKFDKYLKKKISSFDHYIEQLDKYCSISFGYTFLLVFSILAMGCFLTGMVMIQLGVRTLFGIPLFSGQQGLYIDDVLMMIYIFLGFIYFLDFLTMGWIKKFRWLSTFYYPIYRFYGWITFANFYRPIYYNLIDNKLGRKLAMMILPLSIMVIVLMSLKFYGNAYMSSEPLTSSEHWYLEDSYEDVMDGKVARDRASIHAQFIKDDFLKLFVPYLATSHDRTYAYLCPDLEPGYFTGLKLRGGVSAGQIRNPASDTKELLDCAKQLWRVTIDDSLYVDVNFKFYHHPQRDQDGLLAVIPIHDLNHKVEHYIKVDRQRVFNGVELKWYEGRYLWFYKN